MRKIYALTVNVKKTLRQFIAAFENGIPRFRQRNRKTSTTSLTNNLIPEYIPQQKLSQMQIFTNTNTARPTIFSSRWMNSLLVTLFAVFVSATSFGQIVVTVTNPGNATPAFAASYPNFTAAVTALNAVTAMSGPVTFTLAAGTSEAAPIKGFNISTSTAGVLSAVNTLTIVKASGAATVINAGVGTAAGPAASSDGMLYLSGSDYVTIDGLTFTDANSASATVAMEFGIAFFKRAAGDGCNNNTVRNCIFNMQRINNTSATAVMMDGAYAIEVLNSTAAAAITSLTPTNGGTLASNGTNSNNAFYSNTCNGGNGGIGFGGFAASSGVGSTPTATTFLGDLNNIVGAPTLGNSILNFGGGAATNAAAGIRANNQWSININNNTVDNNNGAGVNHATILRGIYAQAGTSAKASINNNTVTVRSGAATSSLIAIDNGIGGTALSTNTIDINNNTIRFSYTTATSGVFTAINNSATAGTVNINTNNIQQLGSTNYPSTGTIPVIVGGSPGGPLNVTNNTISNFVMTGASGTLRAITASTPTGLYTVTGNTIDGLSYTTTTSTGSITGIYNFASATLENWNSNIIRNFSTPTTGTLNGIQNNTVAGTFQCRSNQIYNFSTTSGGAGGFSANGITWSNSNVDISSNIIYTINSTGTTGGTSGTVIGITHSGAATVTGNAIYDLSSNSTNAIINGIVINATGTNTVSNNLIGDLRAPFSTGNVAISGILVSSGTTNNIFHNTVNIVSSTSSASTFGTSAIYFSSSSPVNNVRNNVFVNACAAGPTGGITAAIRYTIAPTSTNYPAANNNNFYYAGIPAANKLIYTEGSSATATNGQQTIAAYISYISGTLPVAGREVASVSEAPTWQSTTGSNPVTTFLKYSTGSASQMEQGGGTGTGISTDYAATTRCPGGGCPGAAAKPDMGAWELNGIAAPACVAPTAQPDIPFNITNIFTNTADVSFLAASPVPSGYLVVATTGAIPSAPQTGTTYSNGSTLLGAGTIVVASGSGTSYTITGLAATTTYTLYVYSYNNTSCIGGPVYLTTSPLVSASFATCGAAPVAAAATNVGGTTFTANWAAAAGSTAYLLDVSTSSVFASFVTGYNGLNVGNVITYNVTGLSGLTTYYYRVRGTTGSCFTSNSGTITLATLASVPWTEGFATTSLPTGWTNTSSWGIGTTTGLTGNTGNVIYFNLWSSATSASFITPTFGAIPANCTFSFDYKLQNFSSPYAVPSTGWGNFQWQISLNGGAFANLGSSYTGTPSSFLTQTISLASYSGSNIQLKLNATWTTGDFYLYFDNFSILAPCTAPASPTGLTLGAAGPGTLPFTFTPNATVPNGYLVVRYATGATGVTAPTNGGSFTLNQVLADGGIVSNIVSGAASSFTISGLSPSTGYDVYVYPYNITNCTGGPTFGTALSGINVITAGCPVLNATITVGASGADYTTLGGAINVLNGCAVSQPTIVKLNTDYAPAGETFPIIVNNNSGASATNTITIRPDAAVSTPFTLTGSSASTLIDLVGAKYYTIDGRPGGTGTVSQLNITNTGTGSAVRMYFDAQNDNLQYLGLKASAASSSDGVVSILGALGTTATNGNNNIAIANNNIDGNGASANGIYASGSASPADNKLVSITNNNIFNYFSDVASTRNAGIQIGSNNAVSVGGAWTISGNSFYQTATRTYANLTGVHAINADGGNTGVFTISNNNVGGTATAAGGTAMTLAGAGTYVFSGFRLFPSSIATTTISGNTIRNISITTASTSGTLNNAMGVNSGQVVISNNTIGSTTTAGSIAVVTGAAGGFTGINLLAGTSATGTTFSVTGNTIAGVALSGANASNFIGINASTATTLSGALTISSNNIGAAAAAVSNSTTGSSTAIIQTNAATATINSNIITNLTSTTATAGAQVRGIVTTGGTNTIGAPGSGNTISNFSSSAPTTGTTSSAAIIGIAQTSALAGQTIAGNTISGLTSSANAATQVTGIYYSGSTGTNAISRNLVYDLSNSNASATSSVLTGVEIAAGTTTISNNLVRLGTVNPAVANIIYGINETGGTNGIYFNSIYVGGAGVATTATNTFAFRSTNTGTRTIQNNIFQNSRSNATTGGKHYAITVAGSGVNPSGLILNYNDYLANGTGAVFGLYNGADVATLSAWKTATGLDGSTYNANPNFNNPAAAVPDLSINAGPASILESTAIPVSGITVDYAGNTRNVTTPDIGAYEFAGISAVPAINSVTASAFQCTATNHTVTVVTTNGGVPITAGMLTLNYSYNGTAQAPITTFAGGPTTWTAIIPAATPTNAVVGFSISLNDGTFTVSKAGTSYADEPLNGATATATASVNPICSGTTTALSAVLSGVTATTFSNSFETGVSNFVTASVSGTPGLTQNTAYFSDGAASMYLNTASTSADLSASSAANINLSGNASAVLTFSHIAGMESPTTSFDFGYVQYSSDGGTTWTSFPTTSYAGTGTLFNGVVSFSTKSYPNWISNFTGTGSVPTNALWQNETINIPAAALTSQFRLRFRYTTDGSTNYFGWLIDNVKIATPVSITSVSWNNGGGTGNPVSVSPISNTTYTGTVTALGCTVNTNGVLVTVNPQPTAPGQGSFPSFQCGVGVPNAFVTSAATAGQLRWYLSANGVDSIPGQWNASLTTYSISATTELYVAFNNGTCESPRTHVTAFVITPDPISATSNGPVCVNTPLNLTATVTSGTGGQIYNYAWTAAPVAGSGIPTSVSGGGLTFGSPTTIAVTPNVAGTYIYTVTGTDGGCIASNPVTVVVKPAPVINTPTAVPATVCVGSSSVLSASTPDIAGLANLFAEPFESFPVATITAAGTGVTWAASSTYFVQGAGSMKSTYVANADANLAMTNSVSLAGLISPKLIFSHICASEPGFDWGRIEYSTNGGTTWTAFPASAYAGAGTLATSTAVNGTIAFQASSYSDWNTQFTGSASVYPTAPATSFWKTETINLSAFNTATNFKVRFRLTSDGSVQYAGWSIDDVKIQYTAPAPYTWSWNPGSLPGSSVTVTPSGTGLITYTVTALNTANSCSNTATVGVTVNPLPSAPSIVTNDGQCGTAVPNAVVASTAGANGTGVFKWYLVPNDGTAITGESGTILNTYSISVPTHFYVSEVGTNGCESARTDVFVDFTLTPDVLTLSASSSPVCVGTPITFSYTQTGGSNSFIFNYPSLSHIAGSGINIPNISGVDSLLLDPSITVTPTVAGTITYTLKGFDPDKGCISFATTTVTVNPLPVITSVLASPSTICEGASSTLTGASIIGGASTATVGTQTTTNLTGGPYRSGAAATYQAQYLFTAADLSSAGIIPGNLTALEFNVTSVGTGAMPNYNITLGTTASSTLTSFVALTSPTVVYNNVAGYTAVSGFNLHTFTTPFYWDGSSNIIVQVCHDAVSSGSSTVAQDGGQTGKTVYNTSVACGTVTGGTVQASRPIIRFSGQVGNNLTGSLTWSWNNGGGSGNPKIVSPTSTTVYTATATDGNGCSKQSTTTATVTVNPLPALPTASDVSRCGAGSVTLSATGTGGTLNWYNVSTGGISLTPGGNASYTTTVTVSGTIFYVAETSAGCEGPRKAVTVTLTSAPALAITAGGVTTFCLGSSVGLNAATASYVNFTWSTVPASGAGLSPTNVAAITSQPTVAGAYTISVAADDGIVGGCSNVASVTVTANPNPVISGTSGLPTTICSGGSSVLTGVSPSGASPTYTAPGTTSNTGGDEIQLVTFNTISNATTTGGTNGYVNYTNTVAATSVNPGQSYNLSVSVANGGTEFAAVWFDWNRNGTFETSEFTSIPLTLNTTYDGTVSITIPVSAQLGTTRMRVRSKYNAALTSTDGATAYTYGETEDYLVTINDPNLVWSWNNGGGTGNPVTVSPTATTLYTATLTNSLTSCFTVAATPVTITLQTVDAGPVATSSAICIGGSTTIAANATGGGPFTYLWDDPAASTTASITVSPSTTTTYSVLVKDACTNPVTKSVTITVNPVPTVTVSPTTATLCQPGSAGTLLTAGGGAATYAWTPAAGLSATTGGSVTATPGGTTTYTVIGTDGNGCTGTATSVITVNNAVQNLTALATPGTICAGASSTLTASASVYGPVASYQFAASTGASLDPMSGATTIVGVSNDDTPMNTSAGVNTTAGNSIPIGFDFNFSGGNFTYFSASPDGWIKLGNDNTAATSQFTNSTTSISNTPKIYPYWDDMATGTTGSVQYVVTGTAPNRVLVVQWYVTIPRATTGAANSTFQAWLYETSGKVEFRYGTIGSSSMSASVGLTSTAAQYQSVTVSSNTASSSIPTDANAGQPASGTMYTFNIPAVISTNFSWAPGSLTGNSVSVSPAATQLYTVTATGSGSCTSTATANVTVNPLTSISVDAAPATQLVGQNNTATALTVTATGTGTITYQWFSNTISSTAGGTAVGTGSSYAPSTVTVGTLFYYAVATGTCGTATSSAVQVNVVNANTNFWTALSSTTNWSTAANWSLNSVPTTLNDIVIPTSPSGGAIFPSLTAASVAKNVVIQNGATISLNGNTLTLSGGVSGAGTFIGSASSNLAIGGTSTLSFASGAGGTLKNLNINAGTTTLATALDITGGTGLANNNSFGTVTVASGAVLASGGFLTFKSNVSGTARLAQGATSGQWVTGDVTVERYIPQNTQRAWRMLSVPTKGGQKINQAWQEGAIGPLNNPKPGFGTLITTKLLVSPGSIGFDAYTSVSGSLRTYNVTTNAWNDVTATIGSGSTGNIETVKGYSLYVRGDRGANGQVSAAVTTSSPTVLRTTGTLYTGDQAVVSISPNKFEMIGNTYVSAIDFLGLARTSIPNTFYIWDPKASNAGSLGAYQTFTLAGGFVPLLPGSYGTGTSSDPYRPNTVIESGQAFFVTTGSLPGSIGIKESAKTTGSGINVFRPAAGIQRLKTNLYTIAADNTATVTDANLSAFDNLFSNGVDADDAAKLANTGENFAIVRDNINLAIEARQAVVNTDTTFFKMWNMSMHPYRLEFIATDMNLPGLTAYLQDNFTGTSKVLDLTGTTTYDFTVNGFAASSAQGRFKIVYNQAATGPLPVTFISISANLAGAAVKVDWKVAGERGIQRYEVERSADGNNFARVVTVVASGNNFSDITYSWMDATPLTGNNFYRIKSIGASGEIKYTYIVKVLIGNVKPGYSISPNPVEGSIVNLQFKNQPQGRYNIRLMSSIGEVIFTSVAEHAGGNSTQLLNLPAAIARGAYQLEIIAPDKIKEVQNLFINTIK